MSEKQKTQYDFRGEIFEKRKCKGDKEYFIIDFACKQKALAGKGKSKFNDGPVVSIDEKSFTIFDLLFELDNIKPTRDIIKNWILENTSYEDVPGIYYVDTGTRRAVITTKSIAGSVAKILSEVISVTNKSSDIFLKRVARSHSMSFKVLSYQQSYAIAATYAGIYDVMAPKALLSEQTPNYRSYPGYRTGLSLGANWQTLLIEELLDEGIRPEGFVSPKELKLWRDKTFKTDKMISREEFLQKLKVKVEEFSQ